MRVIQVGIGGMGNTWLNAVLNQSEVEYAGFVEVNDEIAQTQAALYNLDTTRIFPSLEQALAAVSADGVDGVLDVTPPRFHKSVSLTALNAGIPVLSEKPLADTLADAQAIARRASETGVLHMVAQNRRYGVAAQTLKQVLTSGEMGQIGAVHIDFFKGPRFVGFRAEMPYPLIIDMAIHHFDMLRHFLDSDVVALSGRSWNPPWSWFKGDASASLTMQLANGLVASYNASWCSVAGETSWNAHWRFDCEGGVVFMRDDQVFTQRAGTIQPDQPGYLQDSPEPLITVPLTEIAYADQAYLLHAFYEAVTNGVMPETTCQDNLQSLGIVFGAVQAFETGETVRLAELLG